MSRIARSVKNVTKGYSSVQVKVREATSNDAWGPTGTQMQEIAQMTFNGSTDFYEIMDMLDKRLNDKGKNWRHVLKSLKVLDYILHEGSELVITWSKKNIYIIKTLREFVYVDDEGRDVGQNVRVAAKELTALIQDDERLRSERSDRKSWKSRVTGLEESGSGMGNDPDLEHRRQNQRPPQGQQQQQQRRRRSNEEDDLEYKLALEASKNQAEEDARRRQGRGNEDDADLQKAIKLSKEEEELRKKELEDANAQSLFDDGPVQSSQPQFTGYNQGYQQQGAVDWFGNPIDQQQQHQQQQPQSTGYLNNMYAQQTGYQNPYATGMQQQQQPQQNGFDQFGSPQQQQGNFLQPQQTAFNSNPYQQQPQQQQQQQQMQPQDDFSQFNQQTSPNASGTNNPFGQKPQGGQLDPLKPAPTGSNNPFASGFGRPQQTQVQQTRTQPSLNTIAEQRTAANPITNFSQQPQQQQQQQQPSPFQSNNNTKQSFAAQQRTELDPHRARLNAMLATGDGMDTFGNTGDLRIPAQHTAPSAFVNSAGQNLDRLRIEKTGNNPFMSSQLTGMPQQGGGGFGMPAQTGPVGGGYGGGFGGAGGFGAGAQNAGNNPFGQRPQQQQGGGGSLIDL